MIEQPEKSAIGKFPEAAFNMGPGIAVTTDIGLIDIRQVAPTIASIPGVNLPPGKAESCAFFSRTGFNLSAFGSPANRKPKPARLKPVLLKSLLLGDLLRQVAGYEAFSNLAQNWDFLGAALDGVGTTRSKHAS